VRPMNPACMNTRSFAVDDVRPAEKPIWTEPMHASISKRLGREVLLMPGGEKPVINALVNSLLARPHLADETAEQLAAEAVSSGHPLVDAISYAFSEHRPLTVSPDAIWLVIAQGFSRHITKSAEAMRGRLVRHEGSRELTATISQLDLDSFRAGIADFSTQIRQASDPVLLETVVCDFTTTTPDVRTASEIVLMDTYSKYFTYTFRCVCGIPKVTLLGSVEDWQNIRARIEVLATFELDWWTSRLRPILDEFVHSAMGRPDTEFWQAIYKPKRAYAATAVTGWIADLFPYLGDAPHIRKNHVLENPRERWAIPIDTAPRRHTPFDAGAEKGVRQNSFPSGLTSVPVNVAFANGTKMDLDLVAGFLGVEQDEADLSLSPVISWAVAPRAASSATVA
jgi:hypothetical protein